MAEYKNKDVVGIQTRKGWQDCVIVYTRRITKGKRVGVIEYKLAPLNNSDKVYSWTVVGESLFKAPRKKYTSAQIKKAIQAMEAVGQRIDERKEARKERGREQLGDIDIKASRLANEASGTKIGVGDEVLYKYSNGKKWERVVKMNFVTGKIGIKSRRYTQDFATVLELMGRRPRDVRWLKAEYVLEVRQVVKACPVSLADRVMDELAQDGWTQVRYGTEFIDSSYVVGFSKALALTPPDR